MTLAQDDAWVYARRSRKSVDQASVTDQEEHGQAACGEHGWRYAGTIPEEVSASRFGRKQRQGWEALTSMVAAREIPILILWEADRGSRTLTEWSAFLDLCRETSTRIYVVAHERLYDIRRHSDWRVLADAGVDGAYFSEKQSVNVTRGKRRAAREGRPAGTPPYGYAVKYSRATGRTAGWEIVAEEAAVVRAIITAIGKHHKPVKTTARFLTEGGVPAPNGGSWSVNTVRHIAANCAYAGLVRLPDGTYAERRDQADGAQWPPIVERAEWEAAAAVIASRVTGPRPGGVKHLLSNVAHCECGGMLRGDGRGNYRCVNGNLQVPEEWLDEIVAHSVCTWLSRDDVADLYVVDEGPRMARARSELAELTDRRSAFRKRAALGRITEDALQEMEDTLNPEIARLERELGAVRVVPALRDILGADSARAAWDSGTIQARREIIAAVTGIIVARVPKTATTAQRYDVERVSFDWQPQPPKRGPGGRLISGAAATSNGPKNKEQIGTAITPSKAMTRDETS